MYNIKLEKIILQPDSFDNDYKKTIHRKLEIFQNDITQTLKTSVSFGVGNIVNDCVSITISFSEAIEAWKNGSELYHNRFISFYETKQLQDLLRLIPTENLKNFFENTLQSLAYTNSRDDEELIKTLQVFLDNNCEIAMTAKKLFIHRNTVTYRIAKCEERLNYSIQDPLKYLHLRTALLVRPLFTKTN